MPQDDPIESIENQENLILKNLPVNLKEENSFLNGKNGKIAMTPGAKNILTNRKVLAEKTPNNSNIVVFIMKICEFIII